MIWRFREGETDVKGMRPDEHVLFTSQSVSVIAADS